MAALPARPTTWPTRGPRSSGPPATPGPRRPSRRQPAARAAALGRRAARHPAPRAPGHRRPVRRGRAGRGRPQVPGRVEHGEDPQGLAAPLQGAADPLRPRLPAAWACRCAIALAAYPRTAASLDGLYVRELDLTTDGYRCCRRSRRSSSARSPRPSAARSTPTCCWPTRSASTTCRPPRTPTSATSARLPAPVRPRRRARVPRIGGDVMTAQLQLKEAPDDAAALLPRPGIPAAGVPAGSSGRTAKLLSGRRDGERAGAALALDDETLLGFAE
jgi:hypothetical protein